MKTVELVASLRAATAHLRRLPFARARSGDGVWRASIPLLRTGVPLLLALLGCPGSNRAGDAGNVSPPVSDAASGADTGTSGGCHGVGHYEVGKEGGYLPCCAGLNEVFQQVAATTDGDRHVCTDSVGHRSFACIEGSCGDGRCEGPEGLACGCALDCPSAVWEAADAGTGSAPTADAGAGSTAGPDAGSSSPVPTLSSALRDYQGWTKHGTQPQAISSEIFSLCRLPTAAEQAFVESQHGDGLFLLNWLNDAAVLGAANSTKSAFPVGAAIVKQKLTSKAPGEYAVAALGLMIKREPGFDPQHADWEFGYWEASTGLSTGATSAASCGGCHAGAKTDYVFLDQSWRL